LKPLECAVYRLAHEHKYMQAIDRQVHHMAARLNERRKRKDYFVNFLFPAVVDPEA